MEIPANVDTAPNSMVIVSNALERIRKAVVVA
jgi:hypothetical protein